MNLRKHHYTLTCDDETIFVLFQIKDEFGDWKTWQVNRRWDNREDSLLSIDNNGTEMINMSQYSWVINEQNKCEIEDMRYMWTFFKKAGFKEA